MKNRISQVDGINDSDEENSEKSINAVTVTNKISVKEKNTAKEVIHDLTNNEVWENIIFSGFDVKEKWIISLWRYFIAEMIFLKSSLLQGRSVIWSPCRGLKIT